MASYYNTTRGPLSLSLSSGKELVVPPKSWVEIDRADEGSASLVSAAGKGYFVRSTIADAPVVEPPVPVPPAPPVEEKVLPTPAPVAKKAEKIAPLTEK